MKVLLLEDNLMWSVRVRKGLESLGHTVLVSAETEAMPYVDLAIVNLSAGAFDPFDAVRKLKLNNTRVIGHVGHKDKELWRQGQEAGCDKVVSNGTLANRLKAALEE
jgi:hypothetical protein